MSLRPWLLTLSVASASLLLTTSRADDQSVASGGPGRGGTFTTSPTAVESGGPGRGGTFATSPTTAASGTPGRGGTFTVHPTGPASVAEPARPGTFELCQNTPNPFNPRTTVRFSIAQRSPVHLAIYSSAGQLVRTLIAADAEAGTHQVVWNGVDAAGREVSSGVYLYRLTSTEGTLARRMLLVR
jgi:hypothetical protein